MTDANAAARDEKSTSLTDTAADLAEHVAHFASQLLRLGIRHKMTCGREVPLCR